MLDQNWSEESFIYYLQSQFLFKNQAVVGIGDDCAVMPFNDQFSYLITTDALVEGVHFLNHQISPLDLGYKSVAVNVSDISAMGGEPKFLFLTLAIPKNIDHQWLTAFIKGIREACQKWNILLLGGDTVGSLRDIFINGSLIGVVSNNRIKFRYGAKPGDVICVTGCLGDSAGGLKVLQDNLLNSPENLELIRAHFRPEPNPNEGIWLAKHAEVHAMMDLSDGLSCDLKRLLKVSNCGGIIETTQLPISEFLTIASTQAGWNATEMALTGGEDYCLLFTLAENNFEKIQQFFFTTFGKKFYQIGRITEGTVLEYQKNGIPIKLTLRDFSHF